MSWNFICEKQYGYEMTVYEAEGRPTEVNFWLSLLNDRLQEENARSEHLPHNFLEAADRQELIWEFLSGQDEHSK